MGTGNEGRKGHVLTWNWMVVNRITFQDLMGWVVRRKTTWVEVNGGMLYSRGVVENVGELGDGVPRSDLGMVSGVLTCVEM